MTPTQQNAVATLERYDDDFDWTPFSDDKMNEFLAKLPRCKRTYEYARYLEIGSIYRLGEYIPQDLRKALCYYRIAARMGHSVAAYRLATMFLEGKGTRKDNNLAVYWYRFSAKCWNKDAMLQLSNLFAQKIRLVVQSGYTDIEKSSLWLQRYHAVSD